MPHRRLLVLGIALIVLSTGSLLVLGLRSLTRERDAVRTLNASAARTGAEKIVLEMEAAVRQLTNRCIRDAMQAGISGVSADQAHQAAAVVLRHHPVAAYLLVLDREGLRYPPMRPREVEFPRLPAPACAVAETHEFSPGQLDQALVEYESCLKAATKANAKAFALARVARCLRKLGRHKEADGAMRVLGGAYGDQQDPFGRPYALVAGFELGKPPSRLYDDLIKGRWAVDGETADYFAARFGRSETGPYIRLLRVASAFESSFQPTSGMPVGELLPFATADYQAFVSKTAPGAFVVAVLDLDWIARELFPGIRGHTGITLGPRTSAMVAFKTMFPIWGLAIAEPTGPPHGDWLLFSLAVALSIGVLFSGISIVWLDFRRESEVAAMKTAFMGAVTHELKTPLTIIRLNADTLADARGLDEVRRTKFLRGISHQSDKLTRMIDNVLDLSRIDSGAKQFHFESCDLTGLLRNILRTYEPVWSQTGFSIIQEIDNAAPVLIDREAITHAVLNLLDNAVKYSEDRREVRVSVRVSGREVVLSVQDQGIGIPPGSLERIFERFHRASNAAEKPGHGLGLFLVRHTLNAHGARVEVESKLGQGSCFRMIFPICQKS